MKKSFTDAIHEGLVLFDGAMGTEIQRLNPNPEDFPDKKDGFNDGLILSQPCWIKKIHRSYLEAGADCIETNTFGGNSFKLEEYGYADKIVEFNKLGAEIARQVCEEFNDRYRYVIGSMGPSGYLPSSNDPDLGQVPLDEIINAFVPQAEGLILGGADALLIETSQDILEVKLVIEACFKAIQHTGRTVPIISNVTLDKYGKMLLGTNVQAAYTTVSDMGVQVFGLNCSTGPLEMTASVRWLDEQEDLPILVVPNAGMPQNVGGRAIYGMHPTEMAQKLHEFVINYKQIRIVGGCCGTNPEHIRELRKVLAKKLQN